MLTDQQAELADLIFALEAVQFGAFKLRIHQDNPDAPLSPIFFNLRDPANPKPGPLTPRAYQLGGELMAGRIYDPSEGAERIPGFDLAAGIPNAGDPWVRALVEAAWRLYGYRINTVRLGKVTTEDERHITGVQAGHYSERDRALPVDDLVTGADTKLEAIKALEASFLVVESLLVLIDRQQGGRQLLEASGYRLFTVFTLEELLDHYVSTAAITAAKADEVRTYIAANQVQA